MEIWLSARRMRSRRLPGSERAEMPCFDCVFHERLYGQKSGSAPRASIVDFDARYEAGVEPQPFDISR